MKTLLLVPAVLGLMAMPASAENAHFLGKCSIGTRRSRLWAPNEPAPQEVNASILSADASHYQMDSGSRRPASQKHAETFDGKPDGKFYAVTGAGEKVTAS